MDSNQNISSKLSPLGDNAFPKISGKVMDFLENLKQLADEVNLPPVLDLEGTIKLHGMHADIVFDLKDIHTSNYSTQQRLHLNDLNMPAVDAIISLSDQRTTHSNSPLNVTFQSRNRICNPDSSSNGWPRNIAQFPDALIYLRDRILTRYHEKNPNRTLNTACPLIVAGEWIGPKIQKDVGVSELSHRFVILSIQINALWQQDSDYQDIEASKASIYSIFRSGQIKLPLDITDLTSSNPTLLKMQALSDNVELSCPFAAAFGLPNRPGEGIVWKPGIPKCRVDPKYWFKTKGPISGPENRIDATSLSNIDEKKTTIKEACGKFVSPRRVEQGFEYLLEMGLKPDRGSVRVFTEWILKDVLVEEKSEIEDLEKMFRGAKVLVGKRVKWLARNAFIEQMEMSGVSIA